jgi:hypothetical protein
MCLTVAQKQKEVERPLRAEKTDIFSAIPGGSRCYRQAMIPDRLETSTLSLRPFSIEDDVAVFEYWQSDPGWERYNASVP